MSRLPNHETLEEVRAEAVAWFWREVDFLIDRADSAGKAELIAVLPSDLDALSVLEIQSMAVCMTKSWESVNVGPRYSDYGTEDIETTAELAEMDGAAEIWAEHLARESAIAKQRWGGAA